MNISRAQFLQRAKNHGLVPLFEELLADCDTPLSVYIKLASALPESMLLESVEGGEKLGRYSVVSFEPEAIFEGSGSRTQIKTAAGKVMMSYQEPILDVLQRYMTCVKPVSLPGLPRFFGGALGYCSYEIVHTIEKLPRKNPDTLGWPEARFFIVGDLYVFDNTQQILKLISCVRLGPKANLKKAYNDGVRRLLKNQQSLNNKVVLKSASKGKADKEFSTNVDKKDYMRNVLKAKEHIAAGDIIQVVLSRRNEKRTSASPLDIYRSLRIVNPSPYMYLVKYGDRAIIGSSPEALVRLEDGVASTRPIAGTRKRGKDGAEDKTLADDLLKDLKERAEHLMLVDLARNDLGRVCRYGSVHVPLLMTIERYSHVMHMVSEVQGKIKAGKDAFDLLRATFPAGTVSGAPKIRAMEIIDDLESEERGPYAGALGYFSYSGNMDMAITIRTILWDKGHVSVQTGAGLVADSNPAKEFEETENKARGMKESIRLAEAGFTANGRLALGTR
jgi:anthranilate synthase component 1